MFLLFACLRGVNIHLSAILMWRVGYPADFFHSELAIGSNVSGIVDLGRKHNHYVAIVQHFLLHQVENETNAKRMWKTIGSTSLYMTVGWLETWLYTVFWRFLQWKMRNLIFTVLKLDILPIEWYDLSNPSINSGDFTTKSMTHGACFTKKKSCFSHNKKKGFTMKTCDWSTLLPMNTWDFPMQGWWFYHGICN